MLLILQRLIKWMPVILFFLLLSLDRENFAHVSGYIILLLLYTVILVSKILYAKKEWHTDPRTSKISGDKNIQKIWKKLENVSNPSATFRSIFYLHLNNQTFRFEGKVYGKIIVNLFGIR